MRRREFIAGLGGTMAAWPVAALAQQQTKPTVIWFDSRPGSAPPEYVEGFRRGLAQVGFSEGRDVTVEYHTTDGHTERVSALANEVVNRRPTAIYAATIRSALAAKQATQTIPIIFLAAADPVELGLVASLNRPGGNLTGVASLNTEIATKRLEPALRPFAKNVKNLVRVDQKPGAEVKAIASRMAFILTVWIA
jgi:putative tryptophan/tyrosine transport system substrate-binding protein